MGACTSNKNNKEKEVKPVIHHVQSMNNEDQAIMKCKLCRDNIKAYIRRLQKNETLRKDKAKEELKKNNRDRAKIFLNQSKFYREQIKVADGQLTMIDEQIAHIEIAKQQKDAIQVLEEGNKILKKLNEEVNVEKWEKIADDMNEVKQQQDEIADFLKNHKIDEDKYEDELNEELEKLMKQEAAKSEIELPSAKIDLPEVKKDVIVVVEKEKAKENVEEKIAIAN